MQKIIRNILDIILPPRGGVKILRDMSYEDFAEQADSAPLLEWAEAVFSYRDPLVRSVIWEAKYHANKKAVGFLARAIYELLIDEASNDILFNSEKEVFLVPIPPSKERLRKYGFNTPDLIIDEILKLDEGKLFKKANMLKRIREVPGQTNIKNKKERIRNAGGVFGAAELDGYKNSTMIVIDDVTTTGATLKDARRALKEAKTKNIRLLAVAH